MLAKKVLSKTTTPARKSLFPSWVWSGKKKFLLKEIPPIQAIGFL